MAENTVDKKTQAEELKKQGNEEYKEKNFINAKELYTKAIGNHLMIFRVES